MKKKYLALGMGILLILVVLCTSMLRKDLSKTTEKENYSNEVQEALLQTNLPDSDSKESESDTTIEASKQDSVTGEVGTQEEELDAFIEEEKESNSSVDKEDVGEVTLPFVPFD